MENAERNKMIQNIKGKRENKASAERLNSGEESNLKEGAKLRRQFAQRSIIDKREAYNVNIRPAASAVLNKVFE